MRNSLHVCQGCLVGEFRLLLVSAADFLDDSKLVHSSLEAIIGLIIMLFRFITADIISPESFTVKTHRVEFASPNLLPKICTHFWISGELHQLSTSPIQS